MGSEAALGDDPINASEPIVACIRDFLGASNDKSAIGDGEDDRIEKSLIGGKPDQGGSRVCSTLDALPPRIRPKDLQPVAALLDLLDRSLDVLVVDVAFEVDEKEVGRVAVDGDFGRGE